MSGSAAPAQLRVAIVGAGLMGRWHARYAARGDTRVVAIVDPDEAAAARLGVRIGGTVATFADVDAMLRATAPDVAHICTPLATHAGLVTAALERRVHVLVEKPLAPDATRACALLDLADARETLLCPVLQFPFQRGFRDAQRWLAANGPALRVDVTICSAGADHRGPDAEAELVRDILPHPAAVLCRMADTDHIDVSTWSVSGHDAGELFATGRVGAIAASVCVSARARPARCEARVLSADGTLHLDFFHGYCTLDPTRGGRLGKVVLPFRHGFGQSAAAAENLLHRTLAREPAYPGLASLIAEFHAAVRRHDPSPLPRTLVETVTRWCERIGDLVAEGGNSSPHRRV